jgi:hypothetical protein
MHVQAVEPHSRTAPERAGAPCARAIPAAPRLAPRCGQGTRAIVCGRRRGAVPPSSAVAFRRPQDAEALERWRAVKRALKAQQKAAAKANPKLLALKRAAKERQQAAYEQARERNRAALAEAKKRQREAVRKAKETAAAQRTTALLRKFVRPATTTGGDVRLSALAPKVRPSPPEASRSSVAKPARSSSKRGPVQLAFESLAGKDE